MEKTPSPDSAIAAVLWCLLFGTLGFHRFYVRKYGTGFLMLITFGGFGFWTILDLFLILLEKFTDKEGRQLLFPRAK